MEDVELIAEFKRVCAVAAQIDDRCDSVQEFEPQLVQLLQLARQMSRPAAVSCFVAIVRGEVRAPAEAVPFCMHALRLPEVRDEVRRFVGTPPDPRRMNFGSHVHQAYADDWQDRDDWDYFRNPT